MGKQKLLIEYDFDFVLIGVSFHGEDYKLCWAVNNSFGYNLIKTEDYELPVKNKKAKSLHSFYEYEDEENYISFYTIANQGTNTYLIPEQKNTDYFILIKGPFSKKETGAFISKIRGINNVIMAFEIDVNELKSKNNLVF